MTYEVTAKAGRVWSKKSNEEGWKQRGKSNSLFKLNQSLSSKFKQ